MALLEWNITKIHLQLRSHQRETDMCMGCCGGSTSLTRSSLSSDKVRHDCKDDPLNSVFKRIEESNHNAYVPVDSKRFLNGEKMKVFDF